MNDVLSALWNLNFLEKVIYDAEIKKTKNQFRETFVFKYKTNLPVKLTNLLLFSKISFDTLWSITTKPYITLYLQVHVQQPGQAESGWFQTDITFLSNVNISYNCTLP